jgi:hypothetical protein
MQESADSTPEKNLPGSSSNNRQTRTYKNRKRSELQEREREREKDRERGRKADNVETHQTEELGIEKIDHRHSVIERLEMPHKGFHHRKMRVKFNLALATIGRAGVKGKRGRF